MLEGGAMNFSADFRVRLTLFLILSWIYRMHRPYRFHTVQVGGGGGGGKPRGEYQGSRYR